MTPSASKRAAKAADLLLTARRTRRPIAALPDDCAPRDLASAYAIQAAGVAAIGQPVVGYKIGATSKMAQDFLGVDQPFVGQIMADHLYDSPAVARAQDLIFRLIEPEFAFRLGAALPARPAAYGPEDVAEAVASLHPAIELVTSGYGAAWTTVGGLALIADNGAHHGLVLGPGIAAWRDLDLPGHPVRLAVNGEVVGRGVGGNALGGPLTALTWLANELSREGRGLPAGAVVTTGAVTDVVLLEAGDEAIADFGALREVCVRFTP